MRMRGLYEKLDDLLPDGRLSDTLVIFVYSDSDTEYEQNLQFFVRHGMWEGDGCDYIIVVQQVRDSIDMMQPREPDKSASCMM